MRAVKLVFWLFQCAEDGSEIFAENFWAYVMSRRVKKTLTYRILQLEFEAFKKSQHWFSFVRLSVQKWYLRINIFSLNHTLRKFCGTKNDKL